MRKILLSVISVICSFSAFGQILTENNPLVTAVPFVTITNNARIMGFGDIACVSSGFYSDAGLFQNPAILSGNNESTGIYFSYMPWMKGITEGVNFKNLGFHFSTNSKHAFGLNAQIFDMGDVYITNSQGDYIGTTKTKEMYVQLHYRYLFSEKFSIGSGIKLIKSNLSSIRNEDMLTTFSMDLGFSYWDNINIGDIEIKYNLGTAVTNFGPRIKYHPDSKTHQPATLMIGALVNPAFILNEDIKLNVEIAYQAEKLLVPTPPLYSVSNPDSIVSGKNPDISPFRALYQSFYDAPGGFKEEWHEIIHKFGNEYRLSIKDNFHLAFRWGIFREHETKGNRKYNNTGLSFMAYGFYFDFTDFNFRDDRFNSHIISVGYRNTIDNLKELLN